MKCREASNWLLSSLKPVPLLPGLGKHLRACPKCRRLRRRLRRLDQVFQTVPLPADSPAARARIAKSLPVLAKPKTPVMVRILRAAVILIVLLPWAALVTSLADRPSQPQEVVRKKDGPTKEAPPVKPVQPRGTPEELLVVRFLEGDLHLAETFTPEEHVPVLAAMAHDLSQEILRVARAGQIDDLPLLSALYQRLGQGLVSRAWQVPADRVGAVVTPVVKQLRETAADIDAARRAAAPPVAAVLTRSRDTARSAATLLAELPARDEPVWPGAATVIPAPRGSPRTLLTSLVQQGLRLTQEDDPLLRVEYCRDVADGMLRVIMMDTIKGDGETATRLGQPLGQFMDRSVKAHINQLPPDDPRKIRLQEVLAGAVSLIQDLKGTLMHTPGGTALPKERFKELEKMVKEMKKIAESLDPQWKGKKDDPKGKGKKDDPKGKGKGKKDDKGKGIKDDPKHLKHAASVTSDRTDAWPPPFVYQPSVVHAWPERVRQHLLPALIGRQRATPRGAI
jgi:hypothetical protein